MLPPGRCAATASLMPARRSIPRTAWSGAGKGGMKADASVWLGLERRQQAMLAGLGALLLLVQIDQPYPDTAWLHHLPTLLALVAALWLLRRWPLSDAALGCIVLFLALHTIGGRYTYSAVPYDQLVRMLTGTGVSEAFGFARNHYDRLVHLAYGLLAIVPVREALERHFGMAPRVALYIALESVVAVSALYEIFEWLLTLGVA